MPDLGTTNTFLGIMAVVSVLEALVLIGLGIGAFVAYRRVMVVLNELEQRHVVPLTEKANAILEDVKGITARAQMQAERVDHAISGTMDRVDVTAERMKHSVMERITRTAAVVNGVRAALASLLGAKRGSRGDAAGSYAGTGTY